MDLEKGVVASICYFKAEAQFNAYVAMSRCHMTFPTAPKLECGKTGSSVGKCAHTNWSAVGLGAVLANENT